MSLHLNVPQHMGHHRTPVGEGEMRVPQYGPEWLAHLGAGGDIRDGNILVGVKPLEVPPPPAPPIRRRKR